MNTATARRKQCTPVRQSPPAAWPFWITFVWAAVLAVIFFQNRGSDVSRLPQFLSSFPLPFRSFDFSALRDTALGAIFGTLTVLAWFGFGDALEYALDRLGDVTPEHPSLAWSVAVKCAWGAGVTSLLMFLLGITRLYTKTVALIGLTIGLILFARALHRLWNSRTHTANRLTAASRIALALTSIPVLLAAIASLAPPVVKDALLYHIALPKAFLDARGLADVRYNIAQFYALGAELNGAWAMLLGRFVDLRAGEAAFGFTQFAYLPVLLLAIYGWMRRRGCSPAEALIPVALVAAIPTVFASASSAYNDCALALYVTLAIAAAADWWKAPNRRAAAEIGLAIGFALGVKLLALFLVAPLIILLLLRLRVAENEAPPTTAVVLRSAILAMLLAAAIAAPWYVRNWVRTGSPVFPFYMNIFHGSAPGWDEQRSLVDQFLNARYGGYPKGPLDYVAVPFRLSLTAQPEYPLHFDGVLGISFLFGLPLLLIAAYRKRLDAEAIIAAALSGTFFLAWLFTSEQLRYLLPALPALAVAISISAASLDRRFRSILLATVVPGLLVTAAWFLLQNPVAVVAGAESRNAYLERSLDHYPIYETVNSALPPDARVWLINMRRDTYYLDRPYFSDFRIEHYTLMDLVNTSSSAEEMRQRIRQAGITHILFRADTLFNPATTPIVDDRRSPAENAQKLEMLRDVLFGGGIIKTDGNFVLVRTR